MFLKISGRASLLVMASLAMEGSGDEVVWDRAVASCGKQNSTLWQLLRTAQRTSGCTTKTLATIEAALRPIFLQRHGGALNEDHVLLSKANAVLLQIHGCVGCDAFVFVPSDRRIRCPRCAHPRFNEDHKPNEVRGEKYALLCVCMHVSMHYFLLRQYVCRLQVFWYFPLEHQINQLLKNKKYTYALKYEGRRSQNDRYMSDVYDSPRWQEVAGNMTGDRVTRIVVQLCVDAFPWSSRKHQVFLLLISFFLPTFHFFSNSTVENSN